MSGKRSFKTSFSMHPMLRHRAAAAVALLLAFALQSFDLRAELLFRSVEQVNGQQRWSPLKKYSNPSDIAYAQVSASGAAMPAEEVRVILSGEITPDDVNSAAVMAGLLTSGRQKLAGNSVWLESKGGDIDTGMALGRLLRKLGVFTLVGKNDQCLSACVFAFMGGERRIVAGQLGIHRPYFPFTQDSPDRQAKFRHLQLALRSYIEEMDFPTSLYEAIMLVPPESMQMLTAADLKKYYLDGISPSSEDYEDAASARRLGLSMYEYLQRKATAPTCALLAVGQDRCEDNARQAAARGGAVDDPGSAPQSDTASAGRGTRDKQPPAPSRGTTRGALGSSS